MPKNTLQRKKEEMNECFSDKNKKIYEYYNVLAGRELAYLRIKEQYEKKFNRYLELRESFQKLQELGEESDDFQKLYDELVNLYREWDPLNKSIESEAECNKGIFLEKIINGQVPVWAQMLFDEDTLQFLELCLEYYKTSDDVDDWLEDKEESIYFENGGWKDLKSTSEFKNCKKNWEVYYTKIKDLLNIQEPIKFFINENDVKELETALSDVWERLDKSINELKKFCERLEKDGKLEREAKVQKKPEDHMEGHRSGLPFLQEDGQISYAGIEKLYSIFGNISRRDYIFKKLDDGVFERYNDECDWCVLERKKDPKVKDKERLNKIDPILDEMYEAIEALFDLDNQYTSKKKPYDEEYSRKVHDLFNKFYKGFEKLRECREISKQGMDDISFKRHKEKFQEGHFYQAFLSFYDTYRMWGISEDLLSSVEKCFKTLDGMYAKDEQERLADLNRISERLGDAPAAEGYRKKYKEYNATYIEIIRYEEGQFTKLLQCYNNKENDLELHFTIYKNGLEYYCEKTEKIIKNLNDYSPQLRELAYCNKKIFLKNVINNEYEKKDYQWMKEEFSENIKQLNEYLQYYTGESQKKINKWIEEQGLRNSFAEDEKQPVKLMQTKEFKSYQEVWKRYISKIEEILRSDEEVTIFIDVKTVQELQNELKKVYDELRKSKETLDEKIKKDGEVRERLEEEKRDKEIEEMRRKREEEEQQKISGKEPKVFEGGISMPGKPENIQATLYDLVNKEDLIAKAVTEEQKKEIKRYCAELKELFSEEKKKVYEGFLAQIKSIIKDVDVKNWRETWEKYIDELKKLEKFNYDLTIQEIITTWKAKYEVLKRLVEQLNKLMEKIIKKYTVSWQELLYYIVYSKFPKGTKAPRKLTLRLGLSYSQSMNQMASYMAYSTVWQEGDARSKLDWLNFLLKNTNFNIIAEDVRQSYNTSYDQYNQTILAVVSGEGEGVNSAKSINLLEEKSGIEELEEYLRENYREFFIEQFMNNVVPALRGERAKEIEEHRKEIENLEEKMKTEAEEAESKQKALEKKVGEAEKKLQEATATLAEANKESDEKVRKAAEEVKRAAEAELKKLKETLEAENKRVLAEKVAAEKEKEKAQADMNTARAQMQAITQQAKKAQKGQELSKKDAEAQLQVAKRAKAEAEEAENKAKIAKENAKQLTQAAQQAKIEAAEANKKAEDALAELEKIKGELASAKSKVSAQESELGKLREQLETAKSNLEEARTAQSEAAAESAKQLNDLTEKLKESEQRVKNAKNQLAQTKAEAEKAKKVGEEEKSKAVKAVQDEAAKKAAELEAQTKKEKEAWEAAVKVAEEAKIRAESDAKTKVEEAEKKIKELEEQLKQLEERGIGDKAEFEKQLGELQENIDGLKKQTEEDAKKFAEKTEEVMKAQQETAKTKEELDAIKKQLEELKTSKAQLTEDKEKLTKELEDATLRATQLEEQAAATKKASEEQAAEKDKKIAELEKEQQELKKKAEEAEEKAKTAEKTHSDDLDKFNADLTAKQAALDANLAEIEKLTKEKEQVQADVELQKKTAAEEKARVESLTAELEQVNARLEGSSNEVEKLKKEKADVDEKLEEATKAREEAEQEVRNKQEEVDNAKKNLQQMEKDKEKAIEELTKVNEGLRSQLTTEQERYKVLEDLNKQLEAAKKQLETEKREQTKTNETNTQKLAELEQELEKVKSDAKKAQESAKKKLGEKDAEVAQKIASVNEETAKQIAEAKAAAEELKNKADKEARAKVAEAENQVKTIQAKIDKLSAATAKETKELSKKVEELEKNKKELEEKANQAAKETAEAKKELDDAKKAKDEALAELQKLKDEQTRKEREEQAMKEPEEELSIGGLLECIIGDKLSEIFKNNHSIILGTIKEHLRHYKEGNEEKDEYIRTLVGNTANLEQYSGFEDCKDAWKEYCDKINELKSNKSVPGVPLANTLDDLAKALKSVHKKLEESINKLKKKIKKAEKAVAAKAEQAAREEQEKKEKEAQKISKVALLSIIVNGKETPQSVKAVPNYELIIDDIKEYVSFYVKDSEFRKKVMKVRGISELTGNVKNEFKKTKQYAIFESRSKEYFEVAEKLKNNTTKLNAKDALEGIRDSLKPVYEALNESLVACEKKIKKVKEKEEKKVDRYDLLNRIINNDEMPQSVKAVPSYKSTINEIKTYIEYFIDGSMFKSRINRFEPQSLNTKPSDEGQALQETNEYETFLNCLFDYKKAKKDLENDERLDAQAALEDIRDSLKPVYEALNKSLIACEKKINEFIEAKEKEKQKISKSALLQMILEGTQLPDYILAAANAQTIIDDIKKCVSYFVENSEFQSKINDLQKINRKEEEQLRGGQKTLEDTQDYKDFLECLSDYKEAKKQLEKNNERLEAQVALEGIRDSLKPAYESLIACATKIQELISIQVIDCILRGKLPEYVRKANLTHIKNIEDYLKYAEGRTENFDKCKFIYDHTNDVFYEEGSGVKFSDIGEYETFRTCLRRYKNKIDKVKSDIVANSILDVNASLKYVENQLKTVYDSLEKSIDECYDAFKELAEKKAQWDERENKRKKEEQEAKKKKRNEAKRKNGEEPKLTLGKLLQTIVNSIKDQKIAESEIAVGGNAPKASGKGLDEVLVRNYGASIREIEKMLVYYNGCYEKGICLPVRALKTKVETLGLKEDGLFKTYTEKLMDYQNEVNELVQSKKASAEKDGEPNNEEITKEYDNEEIIKTIVRQLKSVYEPLAEAEEAINNEIKGNEETKKLLAERYAQVSEDCHRAGKKYYKKKEELEKDEEEYKKMVSELVGLEDKVFKDVQKAKNYVNYPLPTNKGAIEKRIKDKKEPSFVEYSLTNETYQNYSFHIPELGIVRFPTDGTSLGQKDPTLEDIEKHLDRTYRSDRDNFNSKNKEQKEFFEKLSQKYKALKELSDKYTSLSEKKIDLGKAILSAGVAKEAEKKVLLEEVNRTTKKWKATLRSIISLQKELAEERKKIPGRWEAFKSKISGKKDRISRSEQQKKAEEARKKLDSAGEKLEKKRVKLERLEKDYHDQTDAEKGTKVELHRNTGGALTETTAQDIIDAKKKAKEEEKAAREKMDKKALKKLDKEARLAEEKKCVDMCNGYIETLKDFRKRYPNGFPFLGQKVNVVQKEVSKAPGKTDEDKFFAWYKQSELEVFLNTLDRLYGKKGIMEGLATTKFTEEYTGRYGFLNVAKMLAVEYGRFKLKINQKAFEKMFYDSDENDEKIKQGLENMRKKFEEIKGKITSISALVNQSVDELKEGKEVQGKGRLFKLKDKTIGKIKRKILKLSGAKESDVSKLKGKDMKKYRFLDSYQEAVENQKDAFDKALGEFKQTCGNFAGSLNGPNSLHSIVDGYTDVVVSVCGWLQAVAAMIPDVGTILSAAIGIFSGIVRLGTRFFKFSTPNRAYGQMVLSQEHDIKEQCEALTDCLKETNRIYEEILAGGSKDVLKKQKAMGDRVYDVFGRINWELKAFSEKCQDTIKNYEQSIFNLKTAEHLRKLHEAKSLFKKVTNHLMDYEQWNDLDRRYKLK